VSILKILVLLAFSIFACTQTPPCVQAQETEFSEYEVKAGFIYNIAKFIEWPRDTFLDAKKPITLCIVGTNPFGAALDTIANKTVQNRTLLIKHMRKTNDLRTCHMLFVSASEKGNLSQILEMLAGASTCTIGDTKGFAQQGIMINFLIEQEKVRFEINTESTRRANLTISSKLLKLARTIYP